MGETIHDNIFDVKDLEEVDPQIQEDDGDRALAEYIQINK